MGGMYAVVVLLVAVTTCHSARLQQQPTTTTTTPSPPTITVSYAPPPTGTSVREPPPVCAEAESEFSPLGRLRAAMRNSNFMQINLLLDAYLIFYSDEHLSEEPSAEERRLEYVSGWDGEGIGAVMADGGAAIWVPSGDYRRANTTLSCAWKVFDIEDRSQLSIPEWISMSFNYRLNRRGNVGGDARLVSHATWQELAGGLTQGGLTLVSVPTLVDQLWAEEQDPARRRPEFSKIVANLHSHEYTGVTWRDKIAAVREQLRQQEADAMVVTALDEVAWLLNIRGRDLPYAPLLKAFVVVGAREVRVYVPAGKLSMPVREALDVYKCLNCTKIYDYVNIYADLRKAPESKILIPSSGTFQRGASAAIVQSVPLSKRVFDMSPIIYLKAQKNDAEARGMRKAHLRDAVAMCTLFSYLEKQNKATMSEMSVSKHVDMTRETQAKYVGLSMRTRVAAGASGTDPDYRATPRSNRPVLTNSTLIIRSGGQYEEGTTVVTRTVHFGRPTANMSRAYTTVVRALAALGTLQAPYTLPAAHADPVARAPLWAHRQDYAHATGYGVGAALNRKEAPIVIDYKQNKNLYPFMGGYFITSEPGWYDEYGKFGVQLGNVLQVVAKSDEYISFTEETLIPFEPKLINKDMLTEYEIRWLNAYNKRIRTIVGPELQSLGLTDVYYWMMNKTVPIVPPSRFATTKGAATSFHHLTVASLILVAVLATHVC